MSAPFQPGDVVVCVDAHSPSRSGQSPTTIRVGAIDRVIDVYLDPADGHWGVRLQTHRPRAECIGYYAFRFRKIEAPKTEIAARIRACKPAKVSA